MVTWTFRISALFIETEESADGAGDEKKKAVACCAADNLYGNGPGGLVARWLPDYLQQYGSCGQGRHKAKDHRTGCQLGESKQPNNC